MLCLGGSQTSGNSTEAQVVTSELNYRTSVRSSVYDYDAVTAVGISAICYCVMNGNVSCRGLQRTFIYI